MPIASGVRRHIKKKKMGDIILGIFILVLIFGGLLLFRLLKKKKVRLIEYINLTITVGGLIGILTTAFDKEFYNHYTTVFWLTIIFFTIQTTTSFYYDKFKRIGIVLLILSFALQTPIIRGLHYSFRSQTLMSINIGDNELKTIDIEPGSYVHYIYIEPETLNKNVRFGINLIPVLFIIAYWNDRKQKQ